MAEISWLLEATEGNILAVAESSQVGHELLWIHSGKHLALVAFRVLLMGLAFGVQDGWCGSHVFHRESVEPSGGIKGHSNYFDSCCGQFLAVCKVRCIYLHILVTLVQR